MHDRYSYAAIVFMALLPDRRRMVAFSAVLGFLVLWNVTASASVARMFHVPMELSGNSGLTGSLGFIVLTLVSVALVWAERRDAQSALGDTTARDAPAEVDTDPESAAPAAAAPDAAAPNPAAAAT
jgi:hypothetical protein